MPSAAPLNSPISVEEVAAAVKALNCNKAADLHGMRSEFIIDAAALLIHPISIVFNTTFDSNLPAAYSIGRLCPTFRVRQ